MEKQLDVMSTFSEYGDIGAVTLKIIINMKTKEYRILLAILE